MKSQKYTLGPTVRKLLAFAAGLAAIGIYSLLHKDPARPNLALIVGIGASLLALAMLILSGVWAYRSRSGRHPRLVEVSMLGSNPTAADSATVEISRPVEGATDFLRVYKVRVDGSIISDLRMGDVCRITMRSGAHTVEVLVDRYGSDVVRVDLHEGSSQHFTVAPTEGTLAERRAEHWLQLIPGPAARPSDG